MKGKISGFKSGLEIAVAVVCLVFLSLFAAGKEGFHMDELLSFELANAKFNPWIVPTQPEGRLAKFVRNEIRGDSLEETLDNLADVVEDVLVNRRESRLLTYQADVYEEPVWITGQQFQDYITVGDDDAFHYLSVYFNVKDDNHPPLHFMLLHTVSSVFRGKALPWMGCVINLAAVAAVLVLLIKLGKLFAEELGMREYARLAGLLCACFYGVSWGAVASVLLVRMYAMVAMWCTAFLYIVVKKWQNRTFDMHNKGLIAVTALGFWTQYFFLFYCILLAAAAAALLLKSKRFREFWCFLRSMTAAALIGLLLFPFAISDVFSSGRGVEALENLSRGFGGYGGRLAAFAGILWERTLGPWFWLLLGLCALGCLWFVLRLRRRAFTGVRKGEEKPGRLKGRNAYFWMLLLPAAGYFLLAARMSPYLVDRYMMPLFPVVALAGTLLLVFLLSRLEVLVRRDRNGLAEEGGQARFRRRAGAACCFVLLMQAVSGLWYDGEYLYRGYREQERAAAAHEGEACICVYDGVGYYENLKEFTYYEKTLLLTRQELEERQDRESIEELGQFVLLVKDGVDADAVTGFFAERYGFVPRERLLAGDSVHGDEIYMMVRQSNTPPQAAGHGI